MINKVLFIINPIFGINRNPGRIVEWIKAEWGNADVEFEVLKTGHRGHGTDLARQGIERGFDMIVAAGGDGTINEVGQGLVGTDTVLGIIPAGSGNGFARNTHIPLNQQEAIRMLRQPNIKKFDVGRINDRYFFNVAGAGLDAVISAKFDNSKMRGPFPYFVVGVKEYFRYQPEEVIIHLDGQELRRSPLLLSFANLPEFGVNATIAPNARPDDGLIDLCILNPIRLAKAIVHLPKLFNKTIDRVAELEIYQTRRVTISRPHDGPIHTDGDPHDMSAALDIEVLPGKLNIAMVG